MTDNSPQTSSFPVPPERALIHRRAVFSKGTVDLTNHLVKEETEDSPSSNRRRLNDESLRLIDNLTNRPVDPLFEDARLMPRVQRSQFSIWANRIVVFIICVVVGVGVTSIVQALHKDPRQKVREKLISQIQTTNHRTDTLSSQITQLRVDIDRLTGEVGAATDANKASESDILNGSVPVHGQGVKLTLTNPIVNKENKDKTDKINLITDADLQWFTSQLWSAGSEAIAINGKRIGTQTSIRLAGQTVLVGTDSVQSPYVIEAIGNRKELTEHFAQSEQKNYLKNLRSANITLQISSSKDITLKATGDPDVTYAKRSE
ncbi:DUF881 domain-containing protein [Bombiscardovia coagulans]|uniref:DUF881 domain-containing protein n=1 Tax=Bombiscardovia coagulans TaxID=686666 RepID=A0A261ESS7_9BIFI|nr:DUF881 domain-containing protein [Bombiscardovia coagulans]OZG49914.1 hypothetical protein BOCO_0431 [Bombiscardovia coagulans]